MTRKRFQKLCMALSVRINEKHGGKVTGEMLRKQRDGMAFDAIIKTHGSYKAAWDWMKPVRDAYGLK